MKQFDKGSKNGGQAGPAAEVATPQETGLAPGEAGNPLALQFDTLAKGIVTGVAVSAIIHAGRSLAGKLLRNPGIMFGLGLASGYLAHQYRKEIIATAGSAAGQGRQFISRQKQHIEDRLA